MIVIKREKKTCYLLQKADTDRSAAAENKEQLTQQGYLVITIIEGEENMEKGLLEIVRNHFH